MALPIRDGNQSLTTLSTILVSNSHITAHTVISFGAQGITDIATAVSGVELGPNTLNALENITVTLGQVTITGGLTDAQLRASAVTIGGTVTVGSIVTHGVTIANSSVTIGGSVTATISGTPSVTFTQAPVTFGLISGTVTANPTGTQTIAGSVTLGAGTAQIGSVTASISNFPATQVISGTVTAGGRWYDGAVYQPTPFLVTEDGALETASVLVQPIPAGTNRIGVVTIGGGTVTIGAGTAQIGSVTASISGTVPVSGTFFQATQPVSLTTLPALVAGTAQIGSVTASISGTVTIFPVQGTSVTTSNFTSTTPSQTIASASSGREILTIFNEGAGNLHVCAGSTCTTIGYQVRLSSGDYWECPTSQVQLIHTAVFATAGTARVTEIG